VTVPVSLWSLLPFRGAEGGHAILAVEVPFPLASHHFPQLISVS